MKKYILFLTSLFILLFTSYAISSSFELEYWKSTGSGNIQNTNTGDITITQTGITAFTIEDDSNNDKLVIDTSTDNHTLNSTLDEATGDEKGLTYNWTCDKLTSGDCYGMYIDFTDTSSPGSYYPLAISDNSLVVKDGRVGIGTATPGSKLELLDISTFQLRLNNESDGGTTWDLGSSSSGWGAGGGKLLFVPSGGVSTTSVLTIQSNGNIGIGTTSPDRLFHSKESTALINTVQQVARLSHITSGTPANNIGVGLEFEQETSADNNEVIATIEAIVDDVTAGSEDGALSLKVMVAGAAATETARFDANATAGNTRFLIYDVDNGTVERVTVGAADSGGAGFKLLRIPN